MREKPFLSAALIIGLTIFAYLPAFDAGFIWDDESYVTGNRTLTSSTGLTEIWLDPVRTPQYYPLVHTSFWIEYRLWKLNPLGYHATNILLHAVSSVLLWRILKRLELPMAWLAASIFALHPVHVESVAWVTERKNILSGFFYLASAWAYLSFMLADEIDRTKPVNRCRYLISLVLFLFALLSKTVTVSLPAVLLLICWWKRGRVTLRDFLPLVPMFAIGIPLALMTVWLEKLFVGAIGVDWNLSGIDRCLIAGRAIWFYAGKLFWPTELCFSYPRWVIDSGVWWQWVYPLGIVAVVLMLWFRRAVWGRGPLVAVLIFAGTLVPALGFFDVYPMKFSFVADHFQYLASIGLIAIFVSGVASALDGLKANTQKIRTGISALILGLLAVLTWQQTQIYHDLDTLWADTIEKNPQSWLAHFNWAGKLYRDKRYDKAVVHARKTVEIKQNHQKARVFLADMLFDRGDYGNSLTQYELALKYTPDYDSGLENDGLAHIHARAGALLANVGRIEEATDHFNAAVKLQPVDAEQHRRIGTVYFALGNLDRCEQHFVDATVIDPKSAAAQNSLGELRMKQGNTQDAVTHFERAIQLDGQFLPARENLRRAQQK